MKKLKRIIIPIVLAMLAAVTVFAVVGCKDKADTEYALTFMVGTDEYAKITGVAGIDITAPADPTAPSGKKFGGWSDKANGAAVTLPATMPAENRTYYALFHNTYSVTLDAGEYGTVETTTIADVSQGTDLYTIIKAITPTAKAGVDPEFGAWFYDGTELTATSNTRMPGKSITIEARYKVGYTVRIFKQAYGEENYVEDTAATRVGKDYVGKTVTQIPTLGNGLSPNTQIDGSVTKLTLSGTAAQNVFKVYYGVMSYSIQFNSNAPQGTRPQGSMNSISAPHGIEVDVPNSEFTISGYRFAGWSETATGDVKYKAGSKLTATRGTVLYAVWDKGLRDSTGKSNDLIFVRAADNEAYLQRAGVAEQKGKYYPATDTFRFTSGSGASETVLLRGCVDVASGKYFYVADAATVEYALLDRNGSVGIEKLTIDAEEGIATYKDKEGKYEFDAEAGALKFKADDDSAEFYFRVGKNGTTPVFEIRSAEVGTYYSEYSGYNSSTGEYQTMLDDTYTLFLDGYGKLTMSTIGFDEGSDGAWGDIINTFGGKYEVIDAENDLIRVTVYADATTPLSATDTFICRLDRAFDGDNNGYSKIDDVTKIYLNGTSASESNTTVITLDGFGGDFTYNDGTNTYAGSSYTLDYNSATGTGTLELYDTTKEKSVLVNVAKGENEDDYYFEYVDTFVDNLFVFADYYYYVYTYGSYTVIMRTFETSGDFEIKFIWLEYDSFYNVNYLDIVTLVTGNLGEEARDTVTEEGEDGEASTVNIYYVNDIDIVDLESLYYTLGILYTKTVQTSSGSEEIPLYGYVSDYSSFLLYLYDDGIAIAGDSLDVYGAEIEIDGVTYKLDGIGSAIPQDDGDGNTLGYYAVNYGLNYVLLYNSDMTETWEFFYIGGTVYKVENLFGVNNASYSFGVYLLEGGKVVMMGYDDEGYVDRAIAWGNGTWTSETEEEVDNSEGIPIGITTTTYNGSFTLTNIVDTEALAVMKEYEAVAFTAVSEVWQLGSMPFEERSFIIVPAAINDEENNLFIVHKGGDEENGDKFIIDYDENCAYVTDKSYVIIYSGENYMDAYSADFGYSIHGDYVFIYNMDSESGLDDGYYTRNYKLVKLIRDTNDVIVDFEIVPDTYAGYYMDLDTDGAYIVLDGITEGTTSANAVFFDGDNDIAGTYASTGNEEEDNEFTFTPNSGDSFTFILGTLDNLPVMIRAIEEINIDIYSVDITDMENPVFTEIGNLSRGGYDAYYTFEYDGYMYTGYYVKGYMFPDDEDEDFAYYTFYAIERRADGASQGEDCSVSFRFMNVDDDGENYTIMLDDLFGVYYGLNDEEGWLMVSGYGFAQAMVNGGEIYGMYENLGGGVIVIKYEYEVEGENGETNTVVEEYKFLCGYYSGIGVFYFYNEHDFGHGEYMSEKFESITLDGYGTGTFVDAYGVSYEGSVEMEGENYRFTAYDCGEVAVDIVVMLNSTNGTFEWIPYVAYN